jgi:RNA polymerase sigma-70 factor, ECF subfamily
MTASEPNSTVVLLSRVRLGEPEALNELLKRHLPSLRRWAHGRLPRCARDRGDTEDLIQATILRCLKHLEAFDPRPGGFRAFLHRAITNRIRDELRRSRRRPTYVDLNDNVPLHDLSPFALVRRTITLKRCNEALRKLRTKDRQLVIARVRHQLTYEQIATRFNKPSANAARTAVFRAVARLASLLATDEC